MGFGYRGFVFCRNNGWLVENMDKGLTVPKGVLINRAKIHQMLQKLSAQIVCQSPKVWDLDEKRLHWESVVRRSLDTKFQTNQWANPSHTQSFTIQFIFLECNTIYICIIIKKKEIHIEIFKNAFRQILYAPAKSLKYILYSLRLRLEYPQLQAA